MRQHLSEQLRGILTSTLRRFRDSSADKRFVVTCRSCRRNVPMGMTEFPFHSIPVECCLCGETQRYRPSEMILAMPHELILRQERLEARSRKRASERVVLSHMPQRTWQIGNRLMRIIFH